MQLYIYIYLVEISIYPYVETLNHRIIKKIRKYKTSAEQSVFKEEKMQIKIKLGFITMCIIWKYLHTWHTLFYKGNYIYIKEQLCFLLSYFLYKEHRDMESDVDFNSSWLLCYPLTDTDGRIYAIKNIMLFN